MGQTGKKGALDPSRDRRKTRGRGARSKRILAESLRGGRKTPLEILLDFANDPKASKELRVMAAKAAAPYVHKRQPQALEHAPSQDGRPLLFRWMS